MVNILVVSMNPCTSIGPSRFMLVRHVCGSKLFASLFSPSKIVCYKFGTQVVLVCGLVETKKKMGLSNFPTAAEGVLPLLVMNTVLSVTLLKNMVRSVLQMMGATGTSTNLEEDSDGYSTENATLKRRVSITQFKSLCNNNRSSTVATSNSSTAIVECCVCLCGFEAEEEVSELSCKHFFHKGCLEKWFDNKHSTCPLCRSIH